MSSEDRSRLHPGRVKWFSACAWLAAVFMLAGPVHAQLVDLGGAHLDTQSALEWRDMGTVGWCSIDQVLADDPVCDVTGWRYATTDEVCDLFSRYALAPSPCPATGEVQEAGDAAETLTNVLGWTEAIQPANPGDPWFVVSAGVFQGPGGAWGVGRLILDPGSGPASTTSRSLVDETAFVWSTSQEIPSIGHLLVREHAAPPAVPALGGWGLGLLGLFLAGVGSLLVNAAARLREPLT